MAGTLGKRSRCEEGDVSSKTAHCGGCNYSPHLMSSLQSTSQDCKELAPNKEWNAIVSMMESTAGMGGFKCIIPRISSENLERLHSMNFTILHGSVKEPSCSCDGPQCKCKSCHLDIVVSWKQGNDINVLFDVFLATKKEESESTKILCSTSCGVTPDMLVRDPKPE